MPSIDKEFYAKPYILNFTDISLNVNDISTQLSMPLSAPILLQTNNDYFSQPFVSLSNCLQILKDINYWCN